MSSVTETTKFNLSLVNLSFVNLSLVNLSFVKLSFLNLTFVNLNFLFYFDDSLCSVTFLVSDWI